MAWWQYLLLVNLYLVLFYCFYTLLLRNETFFKLNRVYLVCSALLSFLIPVIHADWVRSLFITQKVGDTISVYGSPILIYNLKPMEHHLTIGQLLLIIYATGAVILTARFIWQLVSLKKIIDRTESKDAFSFFNNIRLGEYADNRGIISAHEKVHAREFHSADVLLIEAIAIINWFNPIVYLYRLGIKHIHEFIADSQAIKNGTTKAEYALLLLSQTFKTPAHQLVNPFFNQSLLKRRIIMLHKNRSQRMALLKYGLSAPLFILMLILSSATISKSHTVKLLNNKAETVFLTPAPALDNNSNEIRIEDPKVIGSLALKENSQSVITIDEDTTQIKNDGPVFTEVEKFPEFKDGKDGLYRFLAQNIKYPKEMKNNNIQGEELLSFVVEKDGSLSNIHAVKDLGYGAAEESIRVLSLSPKWSPGIQNGRLVRVQFTLPISFSLQPENDTTPKTGRVEVNKYNRFYNGSNKTFYQAAKDTGNKDVLVLNGVNSDLSPLYLLDGKEILDLKNVNPSDIENISVKKSKPGDNSLVLLYGPKATNGVVIIETKAATKKLALPKH